MQVIIRKHMIIGVQVSCKHRCKYGSMMHIGKSGQEFAYFSFFDWAVLC